MAAPMGQAARRKYAVERVAYWKERLRVDPRIYISVSFKTQPDDSPTDFAECDTSDLTYMRAHITFFPAGLNLEKPKDDIDLLAMHEVAHILLHPMSSVLHSRTPNSEAEVATDLEENLIHCLEYSYFGEKAVDFHRRAAKGSTATAVV